MSLGSRTMFRLLFLTLQLNKVVITEHSIIKVVTLRKREKLKKLFTGICLTEWPKKRKVSQNHKTHFIPVFIS